MDEATLVLIRGAGDIATGVAVRLFRSGFPVAMTELAQPLAVRRGVAFSEAVYDGTACVEGLRARLVGAADEVAPAIVRGEIPVIIDPTARVAEPLRPKVVVDAIMAKRNLGTALGDAPLVIGLGPGFTAGVDVHVVIETNRGHNLGRVITHGTAEPNTATPAQVDGYGEERVLRAPVAGRLVAERSIGDLVEPGDVVAHIDGVAVTTPIKGVLRGLIRQGIIVAVGMKIGDVDPRAAPAHCGTVADKALAIGGGVLEAILAWLTETNGGRVLTVRPVARDKGEGGVS